MSNNSSANSACRIHFSASIASHVSSIVSRTWLVTTTKSVTQILRSFAEFAHLGYSTAKDTDGDPITSPIELKDCNGDSDQEFDGFQSNGGFELHNRRIVEIVLFGYESSSKVVGEGTSEILQPRKG